VKAHCLPFSQIPHTTRLFADFLAYTPPVREFYPRSPHFREWAKEEASRLKYDSSRRERVCAVLERQNKSWDCSAQTLASLDRLRRGAAAVVTGQQVGLFGGPMFSIYKALTAVKLAQEATAAGIDCVPVFWLATTDHDLAEVNHASVPGPDGSPQTLTTTSHGGAGAPVSDVRLGEEIVPVVEQVSQLLGESDATRLLREAYGPAENLGSAFARLFTRLFGGWGVILLDGSDPECHCIVEPLYHAAIERADELGAAVLARGEALDAAGYHQQVKVTASTVLLFTLKDGARTAIHRSADGGFVIGADGERVSQDELNRRIASAPQDFSANVLLRPVVQDYLLPTLAYTGGAAETAYFAQVGAVYEILGGRVTPIVPRFSATIVEPKIQRLLEKYGIQPTEVFQGAEVLKQRLGEKGLPQDLQTAFQATNESLEANWSVIREKLERLDRTLVDAAQTAFSKVQYQLERLRTQAARAEAQKGEVVSRHADTLTQALYPHKALQERGVAGIYYLARYGMELLHQLHDNFQSDCHHHQILEL
jgi:bacillithiol biosynthesis cysteine-adding enzyme BshC